jgi:CxxC-x17-CxxC domain-containing protein
LRAQEYCIFNQKYSEADYHQKLAELKEEEIIEKFAQLKINQVRNEYNGLHNVNVSGDYLYDCHNIFDSFDGHGVENCRYCYDGLRAKDCYDICYYDKLELSYQCMSIGLGGMGFFFCYYCRNSYNVYYCDSCHSGRDLFGCVGLRRQDHCILNKKYSDDEYKKIKAQIIAEMEKAGEWGENFPIKNSFFAYNETLAQLYYPLTREEVLARGWRWHEVAKKEIDPSLPICTVCGKNFKIIEQEKKFYQKMNLSEPDICPACLRETLIRQRNPRQLWERICGKCGKKIKTTYAPDRSEKVYCEECYMKEVY